MSPEAGEFAMDMASGLIQLVVMWFAIQLVWSGLRGKGAGF